MQKLQINFIYFLRGAHLIRYVQIIAHFIHTLERNGGKQQVGIDGNDGTADTFLNE